MTLFPASAARRSSRSDRSTFSSRAHGAYGRSTPAHGWGSTAPNPKNFTKEFGIHGRFEAAYVNAAIDISQVRPKVQAPQRLPNVWDAVKQYLAQTFSEVEPLYELEKAGEFNPDKPRAKGTDFIVAELSRAGTFLGSLWYTAWLESGEPVPARNAK